jgi:hypothetical protein
LLTASDTFVEPAYLSVPTHTSSAGGEAADLAASAGFVLDAEQRLLLDVLLAEKPNGKWAAFEACVICARQNGKSAALVAMVLADLYLFGTQRVVWSAHEVDTALESFRDIKHLIESNDHLAREVKRTKTGEIAHEATGREAIEFRNGARLRFKARTRTGGRGLAGDRVVLDEAFALKPAMMDSLVPIMSARSMTGNPQMVYASSAGQVDSAVLRGVRDRGRGGDDDALAYVEWCAEVRPCASEWCEHRPGTRGCALDDEDAWRRANPALGRRISLEYLRQERRMLTPEGFATERLGWWPEPKSEQGGLPLELWELCRKAGASVSAVEAIAVDVTPEFSHASVAVFGGGGLELVAHERGTSWVAALVVALRGESQVPVVVDARGPAVALLTDLAAAGIEPTKPSGQDMAEACNGLLDAVVRQRIWHAGQADLNVAVKGARRQESGDSFRWSRKSSSVDISPLVAATLATWGATQAVPPKEADFYMI